MVIDVTGVLKQMNGSPMMDVDEKGARTEASIRQAIVNAILSPVQNEKGVDKVVKYELAKRIFTSDEVDLNETEIKLIKDRVGELYAPIIVGQVYELLKV